MIPTATHILFGVYALSAVILAAIYTLLCREAAKRRQAEARLLQSDRKFQSVFNELYEFVGLLTPKGIFMEVNQAQLTFAQVTREAILGKPFWEFPSWRATPELTEIAKTAVTQAAAGHFFRAEVTLTSAAGQPHTLDVSVKPVYQPNSQQIVG